MGLDTGPDPGLARDFARSCPGGAPASTTLEYVHFVDVRSTSDTES